MTWWAEATDISNVWNNESAKQRNSDTKLQKRDARQRAYETTKLRNNDAKQRKGDAKQQNAKQRKGEMALSRHHTKYF